MKLFLFIISVSVFIGIEALDNGVALTPPMGWISWARFSDNFDCVKYPKECISEELIKEMTDIMADTGFGSAGYKYVVLDSHPLTDRRDENGKLLPNSTTFPSGFKALGDYIHSKGLKFGMRHAFYSIFNDDNEKRDLETFAEWGVDFIKINADSDGHDEIDTVKQIGKYMNKTGRPIVYYLTNMDLGTNYSVISEICNMYDYISTSTLMPTYDTWESLVLVIDSFSKYQDVLGNFSGPGYWSNANVMSIGNYGYTVDMCKVQMAMYAMFSSPLMLSTDLRTIRPEFKEILLNRNAIEINQDPMGVLGKHVSTINKNEIFTKPILPKNKFGNYTSYAIAVLNKFQLGAGGGRLPQIVELKLSDFGLLHSEGYNVQDVFEQSMTILRMPNDTFKVKVNPNGVVLLTAKIVSQDPVQ